MLQDWGVVTAAPRRGIVVVMDADTLKRIEIPPEAIACHLRRYLDSLDLLALTVEQVALHAASSAQPEDGERLQAAIKRNWEQPYEHQRIPRTLLDFISEHIDYAALKDIYQVLARNLSIGRSIPKLVSREQNEMNLYIYQQCMDSCQMLLSGDREGFARAAAEMFGQIDSLVRQECRQLGYWEMAMQVYDGALLWQ